MKENFLFRWLPILLWVACIFITSANPNPYRPLPAGRALPSTPVNLDPRSKKMSRDELLGRFSKATEYLIRPAFTARALVWRGELRPGLLGVAFALSTLDALSDETRQLFVPGRGFELIDLTLDLGGFAIGVPHMGSS